MTAIVKLQKDVVHVQAFKKSVQPAVFETYLHVERYYGVLFVPL